MSKSVITEDALEIHLTNKELVEVSLYMYQQWQEAMTPPIYAYYDFPTWLNRLNNHPLSEVSSDES